MELWDLYTKDRIKTGETMVRGTKCPSGAYRLVVHICIFNQKGEMLIQQRQPFKSGWSNYWDVTVGGSATAGDNSQSAAERELREELGLDISLAHVDPSLTLHRNNVFDDVYLLEREVDLKSLHLQYEEVQAVKWASLAEIYRMIDEGSFIPYHKSLVSLFFDMRNCDSIHVQGDPTRH